MIRSRRWGHGPGDTALPVRAERGSSAENRGMNMVQPQPPHPPAPSPSPHPKPEPRPPEPEPQPMPEPPDLPGPISASFRRSDCLQDGIHFGCCGRSGLAHAID